MKLGGSLALAMLMLPAAGIAQTQARPQGSFDRRIDVTASAQVVHDSNALLNARRQVAGATGDNSDQRFLPSLLLDIVQPVGRQSLFASGTVGYQFYRRYSRFNSERINVQGGANLRLSRCTGQLSGGLARQQSNLGDLLLTGTQPLRNIETTVNYGGDVSCGGPVGLTPSLGYRHVTTQNSALFRKISNLESDTYTAQLGYTRPSLGVISVYGSYRDGSYPNRRGIIANEFFTDGIEVYTAGLQYERAVTSRINGRVSLGYSHVKPKGFGVKEFKGLSYDASVLYSGDRLSVSLEGRRAAEQSNLLNISYEVGTSVDVNVTYVLGPRLRLLGGAGYAHRQFQASPLVPIDLVRGSDNTYRANAGVRLQLRDRLGVSAVVSREERNSTSNLLDYKATRISASAEVTL